MKILFITDNGNWPLMYRLQKEGMNIKVYVHDKDYYSCYKNIMPRVSLVNLKKEVKNSEVIIFTMTRPNRNTKEDRALLKIFGLSLKLRTVFGPVGDKIKKLYKDKKVIGISTFTEEKMEMDRAEASKIAKEIGFDLPITHKFKTLKEGIKFLGGQKKLYVFKADDNQDLDLTYVETFDGELINKIQSEYIDRVGNNINYILQEVIEGTEISTEGWYNGKEWTSFNHTIEYKTFLSGNLGPQVGSSLNTVWVCDKNIITEKLSKLNSYLDKYNYIGPIDINCIVKNNKVYFLEFSPRMTTDAHYCLYTLLNTKISDFLLNEFKGTFSNNFSGGARLSIPPYPYANKKFLNELAKDVSIESSLNDIWWEDVKFDQGLKCAGSDAILGVIVSKGKTIQEVWNKIYTKASELKISSYKQYRNDGARSEKVFDKLQKKGII